MLVIVALIGVLVFAMRKRRQKVRWRSRSPESPYTERSGRVLIRGHSYSSRPLARQEWRPPLVSEITEDGRDDDQLYSEHYDGPVVLHMTQKDDYGSIMAAVHNYEAVANGEEPGPAFSAAHPRTSSDDAGHLISFQEKDVTNVPSNGGSSGWVQADISTPDPFVDPEPESLFDCMMTPRYTPVASSSQLCSSPPSQDPFLAPERVRGGNSSTLDIPSGADATSNSLVSPSIPCGNFDSSSSNPSSLLNPPLRPTFTGTLTDLVSSSGPPVLQPIAPFASPGESIDSYHPDGLLDPALLESRSEDPRPESASTESLVDHVDYSRPISSVSMINLSNLFFFC